MNIGLESGHADVTELADFTANRSRILYQSPEAASYQEWNGKLFKLGSYTAGYYCPPENMASVTQGLENIKTICRDIISRTQSEAVKEYFN